jgi:exonuclease III
MESVTITTLNIGAASKQRARRILDDWIARSVSDVYVLTETSEGEGTQLIASEFKSSGWAVFQRPTNTGDRGVLIASRISATESSEYPIGDPAPGRSLVIDLQTTPSIQLTGMYVPNRGNDPTKLDRKKAFLNTWLWHFLFHPASEQGRVLIGDLNVVPPSQHPTFLPQQEFEYLWYESLIKQVDLCDVAVDRGTSGHESTWVAHTGEGYTYDHIMLERSLLGCLSEFKYDHSTRSENGVSDHSALSIFLKLDKVTYRHRYGLLAAGQHGLFEK